MKEEIKVINEKAANAANNALNAAKKYVSLFRPDIFGKQKRSDNAEEDFFRMAEELKRESEIFFECAEAYLLLEEKLEAAPESQDLHKKAVLLSEINDLCTEPFLKRIYSEALNPTVDVGKIKRSAEIFSVKLKNHMARIF
jgi:hypothetical protein